MFDGMVWFVQRVKTRNGTVPKSFGVRVSSWTKHCGVSLSWSLNTNRSWLQMHKMFKLTQSVRDGGVDKGKSNVLRTECCIKRGRVVAAVNW
jgi:hypothetical protein